MKSFAHEEELVADCGRKPAEIRAALYIFVHLSPRGKLDQLKTFVSRALFQCDSFVYLTFFVHCIGENKKKAKFTFRLYLSLVCLLRRVVQQPEINVLCK